MFHPFVTPRTRGVKLLVNEMVKGDNNNNSYHNKQGARDFFFFLNMAEIQISTNERRSQELVVWMLRYMGGASVVQRQGWYCLMIHMGTF